MRRVEGDNHRRGQTFTADVAEVKSPFLGNIPKKFLKIIFINFTLLNNDTLVFIIYVFHSDN